MDPVDAWVRMRWPLLMLAGVFTYSVTGLMILEGFSFVNAVYMTVVTLTTVGFREVEPLGTVGKLFMTSVIVMGVGLVLVSIAMVARYIEEGGFGEWGRRRRMQRRIDNLKDHFIICAYGRVGRTVAREFEAEGVGFVVVEALSELEEQMVRDGVNYIIGDPTNDPILIEAGIERARGLVCAMDSDSANVYVTLAARSVNPDLYIVARAAQVASADRLSRAGANRVVSPYATSGRHMALLVLRPRVLDYLEVGTADAPLRLEELHIEKGSVLVGRPLSEAATGATTLAVQRSSGEVIPNPDPNLSLKADDILVVLGEREALRPLEES